MRYAAYSLSLSLGVSFPVDLVRHMRNMLMTTSSSSFAFASSSFFNYFFFDRVGRSLADVLTNFGWNVGKVVGIFLFFSWDSRKYFAILYSIEGRYVKQTIL